ncbi:hypothetical protein FLX08_23990 [Microbispora hainanensis]|uniref:Uncharacterized protein n=1 Tax=Microbispora hainanensis TaxID=568844 RepID=A0A544YPE5_9ACTN|nr:hypothetical protein FLX08_23990 [Microbispora hainanensis]
MCRGKGWGAPDGGDTRTLGRPDRAGRPPKLADAELLTLAIAQALLGIRSEARRLRSPCRMLRVAGSGRFSAGRW